MNVSADTTPENSETTQLWPESNSRTDLQSYRKWIVRANKMSPFLNDWTIPYGDWKPSLELATVNPQEIVVRTTTSPLVSSFADENPLYLTLFSIPAQFPSERVPWTSRIVSHPERVWMVSQPFSATEQLTDTVPDAALEGILLSARGFRFEDGVESEFSRRLVHFITTYGNRAVRSLTKMILDRKIPPEVASEALVWLARIKDTESYEARRLLLIKALLSPSSQVRDGASLGLALLNDRAAIPWARLAVQWERNNELKNDMSKVLAQLESR